MDSSQKKKKQLYKLMKTFSKFQNIVRKQKKYSNESRGVNIDQSAMCYTSMDSSRQAL